MNQLNTIHLLNSSLGPAISVPCQGQIGLAHDRGIGATYLPPLLNLFWTGDWPAQRKSQQLETVFFPFQNSWLLFEAEGSAGPFVLAVYVERGQLQRQLIAGDWQVSDWLKQQQALTPEGWYKRLQKKKLKVPPRLTDGSHQQRVFRGQLLAKERKALQSFCLFPQDLPHFPPDFYSQSSMDVAGALVRLARLQEVSLDLKSLSNLLHSFSQRKQELDLVIQLQPSHQALDHLYQQHLHSQSELQALVQELFRKHPIQLQTQRQLQQELKTTKARVKELEKEIQAEEQRKPGKNQQDLSEETDLHERLAQQQAAHSLELQLRSLPKDITAKETCAFQVRQQAVFREGQVAEMQRQLLAFQFKALENQEKREKKELEKEIQAEEQQLLTSIEHLELQIQQLNDRQDQLKGTFLSWLEARYPGWEQSIGKVAREEILLHPFLAPQIERLNDLFYGIQLDLTEVEVELPNEHLLETQLEALTENLDREQQKLVQFRESAQQKQERFQKRFQQKQRNLQKEARQAQHAVEQSELQLKKWQAREAAHVEQWTIQQEKKRLELEAQLSALQDRPSESANRLSEGNQQLQQELTDLKARMSADQEKLNHIKDSLGTWKTYQTSFSLEIEQEGDSIEALPESFSDLLERFSRKAGQVTQSRQQVEKSWQAFASHFSEAALWGIPVKWEALPLVERLERWAEVYQSDQLQQWQRRLLEESHQLWGQIREVVKPYVGVPTRLQAIGQLLNEQLSSLQQGAAFQTEWVIEPHPLIHLLNQIFHHTDQLGDASGRSLFQSTEEVQDPLAGFPLLAQLSELLNHWSEDQVPPRAAISLQQQWRTAWGEQLVSPPLAIEKRGKEWTQLAVLLLWKQTSDAAPHDWALTFCSTSPLPEEACKRINEAESNSLHVELGPLPERTFTQQLTWELQAKGLNLISLT